MLVTGGAGFIGSTLVDRLLAEGRHVVAVDDLSSGSLENLAQARRQGEGRFEFVRVDVIRGGLHAVVARHRPEVIHHLAAQVSVAASAREPVHDAMVNVVGTIQVLEAAREHGVRKVVLASSGGSIYGEPDLAELPVSEEHALVGHAPYATSKIAAEQYLRTYEHLAGVQWTSLALANVYGPRQDPDGEAGVVAIFTDRMLAGRPVTIFGDGEATRDYVYVDDVVHAFVLASERGDGERCNIGTGERTSVNRLQAALAAATGSTRAPRYEAARPGELRHSAVDASKAARVLGWKPWTTLEEGLALTLRWAADRESP